MLQEEYRSASAQCGEEITLELLGKMPYCSAVVNEVLRIRPSVPVALKRALTTIELEGFQIPAGWQIWCHLGDAVTKYNNDEFNPGKWLSTSGDFSTVKSHYD